MSATADAAESASTPHLRAAGAALSLVVLLLIAIQIVVHWWLPRAMSSFATRASPIKLTGNVLQTEAFHLPGSLPIYGSSELDRVADNRPDVFFRDRPTGFSAFPVGRGGCTCLLILQKLAAAGAVVRGKKAVVFLSPPWFIKNKVADKAVVANLTPALLGGWIFDGAISPFLKTDIARRVHDYPGSLEKQPLLAAAVDCLRRPTPLHRLLLAALTPAGWAQNLILRWVEHGAIFRELLVYGSRISRHGPGVTAPPTGHPDWTQLAAIAEARDRERHKETIFSATATHRLNKQGHELIIHARETGSRDEVFIGKLRGTKEWDDLALLIRGLKELGANVLFISQPFNGIYNDLGGNSGRARAVYYTKLEQMIRAAGYPLLDFSDREEDRYFFNDTGHPSAKAWIFYDEGIDHFYHEKNG